MQHLCFLPGERRQSCLTSIILHFMKQQQKNIKSRHLSCTNRVSKSLHMTQMTHQGGAYPGFLRMKRLGVFLLRPEWDDSTSQDYRQQYPCIYLSEERHCESKVSCQEHKALSRSGLEPGSLDPQSSATVWSEYRGVNFVNVEHIVKSLRLAWISRLLNNTEDV